MQKYFEYIKRRVLILLLLLFMGRSVMNDIAIYPPGFFDQGFSPWSKNRQQHLCILCRDSNPWPHSVDSRVVLTTAPVSVHTLVIVEMFSNNIVGTKVTLLCKVPSQSRPLQLTTTTHKTRMCMCVRPPWTCTVDSTIALSLRIGDHIAIRSRRFQLRALSRNMM